VKAFSKEAAYAQENGKVNGEKPYYLKKTIENC